MEREQYIIFDLEASCEDFSIDQNFEKETIEIGAVKIDSDGKVIDTFTEFTKPKINPILTNYCKDLTTIKQSDVDFSETFDKVYPIFLEWVGEKDTLFLSWGDFDKNQIIHDCALYDLEHERISNNFMNLKKAYSKQIGGKQRSMKKALQKEKIEMDGTHHRGIDDALNLNKIFTKYFDIWLEE